MQHVAGGAEDGGLVGRAAACARAGQAGDEASGCLGTLPQENGSWAVRAGLALTKSPCLRMAGGVLRWGCTRSAAPQQLLVLRTALRQMRRRAAAAEVPREWRTQTPAAPTQEEHRAAALLQQLHVVRCVQPPRHPLGQPAVGRQAAGEHDYGVELLPLQRRDGARAAQPRLWARGVRAGAGAVAGVAAAAAGAVVVQDAVCAVAEAKLYRV